MIIFSTVEQPVRHMHVHVAGTSQETSCIIMYAVSCAVSSYFFLWGYLE